MRENMGYSLPDLGYLWYAMWDNLQADGDVPMLQPPVENEYPLVEYTLQAYELAYRPYQVVIEHSTDEPDIWYARHPELPGCMTHGCTPDDAEVNLMDARLLFIQCLLDDGLLVPDPDTRIWRVIIDHITTP